MKRKVCLLLAVLMILFSVTSVFAASSHPSRVVDNAGLLTSSEEVWLAETLDEISVENDFDIAVVTVMSLEGKTVSAFADDYYDYNGYGLGTDRDGILLLICIGTRDYYMTTSGFGIRAFTDYGINYIGDAIIDQLSDGEYYDAFDKFASLCENFVQEAKNNEPYDYDNEYKEVFDVLFTLLISVAVGFVFALIVLGIMKSKHKTVRRQPAAQNYVKQDSFNLTVSNDIYLYRRVSRTPKPKSNSSGSSTHRSSSGRSHGGGGGRF
jgi:uncharacterized protein